MWSVIPLTCLPNAVETFKITLDGGKRNANVRLDLRYFDLCGYWCAKVTNNATGEVVIDNMPLVCGVDLLGQYEHLGLGHAYIMPAEKTTKEMPDNTNLGSVFKLVWGDDS